jgi:hypothetical protein
VTLTTVGKRKTDKREEKKAEKRLGSAKRIVDSIGDPSLKDDSTSDQTTMGMKDPTRLSSPLRVSSGLARTDVSALIRACKKEKQ